MRYALWPTATPRYETGCQSEHQIDEGRHVLERALALHGSERYVIQAAIADLHLQQPHDRAQIPLLYKQLEQLTSSPVVGMNRAIAVAELEGPEAALAVPHQLEGLDGYRHYPPPAPTCFDEPGAARKHAPPTPARSS